MRLAARLIALLLVAGIAAPGVVAAAPAGPRVVVIVGPVGEATGRYLARGEAAAREAERHTSNVVRVFTPNATWPAVRSALQGASLVVYLGHGNGWPSRYRNELFPPTQNGFGLNPVAGGGNHAHQYFGEQRLREEIELADGAVVLLHHLCYASGNTEPGLPEGTVDEAMQRVDNYAAGFIAAGASAVVAEGHMSPAWYVRQLLSASRPVARVWAAAPTSNGNTFSFESARSPGFVASMDPDAPGGGFYRSLVTRQGADGGVPAGSGHPAAPQPAEPTLVGTGLELGTPYFKGRPIGGADVELWLPWARPVGAAPVGLTVGVRWDPIDVPADDAVAPPDEPPVDGTPDRITLAQPEQTGTLVEPVAVHVGATRLRVPLAVPAKPGRYRLVLTLHDAAGVAYDTATQALVPSLLVRVAGDLAAEWIAPTTIQTEAAAPVSLPVTVANVGATTWGDDGVGVRQRRSGAAPQLPLVVGRWVRLDSADGAELSAEDPRRRLDAPLAAGATAVVDLVGTAPDAPGDYLLVLDVVVPGQGSLAARGAEPPLVRVVVE